MPSSRSSKPAKRVRAKRLPMGKLTPMIEHHKVLAAAVSLRDAMADCTLSDEAISLIALRVNTQASTAKIARGLNIPVHTAHVILARPQAQQLMAEMATSLLGVAAIDGLHTMQRIMRSKDAALAYRAADAMMERAGLGISQRATPDGATKTVFAFAFGGAPPVTTTRQVAVPQATDGTRLEAPEREGPSKTGARARGEALPPAISELPEGSLRAAGPRRHKSSGVS